MNWLLSAVSVLFQFLALVFFADFVSGVFHWLEDAYGHADIPVIGRLFTRPNIVHHHHPRWFLRHNWWQSSWDLLCIGVLLLLGGYWLHRLTWHVWVFAALTANVNQFHKWAHGTRTENGRLVSLLHDLRLLQTPRHHALHHTDPKNQAYCVVTNALNPFLDRLRFWDTLERIVQKLTGLPRRADTSVSGQGPTPEWLNRYTTH